jgi:hypothetical protein
MSLWMLALAGCGAEEEPVDPGTSPTTSEPPETTDPFEPSPWDYQGTDATGGDVDLDALGRAIDAAVLEVLSLDPRAALDPYLATYAQSRTPSCPPAAGDGLGNVYWQGYCTAPDGATFGGYLTHYAYVDYPDVDFVLNGDLVSGVITVTDAAGHQLDLEGEAQWLTGVSHDGSTELVSSYLNGGFAWDGPAPGWLADGRRSVSVAITGIAIPIIDLDLVIVSGSVTPEVDGELYAVQFPDNHASDEAIGLSDCALEPGGTVHVRDAQGRWVDIDFHGPILEVDLGDPTRCDGCGDAFLDGEPLGPVCADFTPWLAWEAL